MSEIERRRRYRYNHVLIESARILDPQFSDAVVFLSGAQIELLRNVTQYLNRQDTYVAEYEGNYYLVPTDEDFDSIQAIIADLEETLMGNPNTIWGYKDQWFANPTEISVGDSATYVETSAVPAGYVYVLEHYTYYHTAGIACNCNLIANLGGANPIIDSAPAVPSDDPQYDNVRITLKEGDTIQLRVTGLPVDELATLRCLGFQMVVPE